MIDVYIVIDVIECEFEEFVSEDIGCVCEIE